jgi:hypothetical protein
MAEQIELFPQRTYRYVDCEDERGNRWAHRVSDPEETCKMIEAMWPGVKARVRG